MICGPTSVPQVQDSASRPCQGSHRPSIPGPYRRPAWQHAAWLSLQPVFVSFLRTGFLSFFAVFPFRTDVFTFFKRGAISSCLSLYSPIIRQTSAAVPDLRTVVSPVASDYFSLSLVVRSPRNNNRGPGCPPPGFPCPLHRSPPRSRALQEAHQVLPDVKVGIREGLQIRGIPVIDTSAFLVTVQVSPFFFLLTCVCSAGRVFPGSFRMIRTGALAFDKAPTVCALCTGALPLLSSKGCVYKLIYWRPDERQCQRRIN